jgi:hypothetical protein
MSLARPREIPADVVPGRPLPDADTTLLPRAALVAGLAALLSLRMGWKDGALAGRLIDTDSYTRVGRLLASVEARVVLDHIPRDNGGTAIALHWSHLLDGLILLLALPLMPLLGAPEALRLAGAALGPLGVAAAALAAMYAARVLGAGANAAMAGGILAALSPAILGYGAFGRADHHVILGALALVAPALALAPRSRAAMASGITAGVGLWLSPEFLPFMLLCWAAAILRDADAQGRIAGRSSAFCLALLATLALALLFDPPPAGRMAVELDRHSRPFLELALLMTLATLLSRRAPELPRPWPAAFAGAAVALLALVPWLLLYPGILRGAEGVFSPEAWTRIWRTNSEMRSPLWNLHDALVFVAVPLLVLAVALVLHLRRRHRPIDLLALAGIALVAWMACRHVRLTIYPELAGAVAGALLLDRLAMVLPASRRRLAGVAAGCGLALAPYLAGMAAPAAPSHDERAAGCDARAAAPALAPFAGRIVLTWINDAPALLWFSGIVTVAGPYHRAEQRIFSVMDAFAEKAFATAPPATFKRTGAIAVLVCTTQQHAAGSFADALARGAPPPWLAPVPVAPDSGYRLYAVR